MTRVPLPRSRWFRHVLALILAGVTLAVFLKVQRPGPGPDVSVLDRLPDPAWTRAPKPADASGTHSTPQLPEPPE